MKFIIQYLDQFEEIEIETKGEGDVDLPALLKLRAKQLFPQLKNNEIELMTECGFELINNGSKYVCENDNDDTDIILETKQVKVEVVEENWTMIKNNQEMNLLNEVCKTVSNINIEEYSEEIHKQIRDDLIVSFQPYYSYFVDKLTNLKNNSQANMNQVFIQIINSIHKTINEFNFTGAYIVKLCCDYLSPSFHISLDQLPSNLQKHKQEYTRFIDEHLFDIVAAASLKDKGKIEILIEGHSITVHRAHKDDWEHRINKIMKQSRIRKQNSSDLVQYHLDHELILSQTQEEFYQDYNFEVTKLKLKMKCQLFAESWISIQVLKRVYADQNTEFEELEELQEDCVKCINLRQNAIESLVIKSLDLTFEELMNEIEMLVLPEESKSILLIQLYSLRPQVDIKIPDYVREKHESLLSQGEFNESSVVKHDQKISCLCLDGGGIRGVIQLIFLTELENLTKKKCSEIFEFFGGTSIGGIISLALASGHSAQSLLYKFIGSTKNHIFPSRNYIRYLIGVKPDGDDSQFKYPLYDKEGIESELFDFFNDIKIEELKSNVLITSCEIQNNELIPVVFTKLNNLCGKQNIIGIHPQIEIDTSYSSVKVRDIARASSAAYPFFAATVINGSPFVDGGFLFNNVDILVTTYLLGRGYKKQNIKMLSLGNAPKEMASSSNGLEHARTAILGLVNSLKGMANPETYYEQYFAMANLNLDHSLQESKNTLKDNYIRLEPDYSGQVISLDSVTADSVNKLKTIGVNWINHCNQNNVFNNICDIIFEKKISILTEDPTIQIMPRYFSYKDSYEEIEASLNEQNDEKWKTSLMNFVFKDKSQTVIEPKSIFNSIKQYISKTELEENQLLNRASAIGHIPSIKKILKDKDENQKKEIILKESINYWNSLHFAAANGEIVSFVYLLSVLLQTDLFLPKTNSEIPERMKKCLSNIQWISIRQNIRSFLYDKMSKNLPFSNVYGPIFNYHQVDTLHLAIENKQEAFEKLINLLLSD
ncbi:hypothetical protein ABPG72_017963 [Tetrahymena utriculariae]